MSRSFLEGSGKKLQQNQLNLFTAGAAGSLRFKEIEVSKDFEKLRGISYENLGTQTGKQLMMNRSIQVEGSFADIKWNSEFTRFLCRGTEKVHAECTLFAMAHNIGWLHTRIQNDKPDLHLYDLKDEEEAV